MSISRNDRMERAARWWVQSQDKSFSSVDQTKLAAWLAENPANREAFNEMDNLWLHVGAIETVFTDEQTSAVQQAVKCSEPTTKNGQRNWLYKFFNAHKTMGIAVAMAMLMLMCLPFSSLTFLEQPEKAYAYSTATGEQKTITLSDGSILNMNVSSAFTVQMGTKSRQVVLNEGEVFFTVKPDPKRPFEVHTSQGLVRVLGTGFNIKDRGGLVAIDVDHGKVQVQDAPKGSGDMRIKAITLLSGQGADIDKTGRLAPARSSRIQQVLAWQQQQIVFKNTPISSVLKELALYHNVTIKLALKEVGQKRVTGTFDMNNLEQTLKVIVTAASLHIKKDTNGTITLSGQPVVKIRR